MLNRILGTARFLSGRWHSIVGMWPFAFGGQTSPEAGKCQNAPSCSYAVGRSKTFVRKYIMREAAGGPAGSFVGHEFYRESAAAFHGDFQL